VGRVDNKGVLSEQLQQRGIRDPEVLRAMDETPRHLFIPESLRDLSYEDHPVAIGHGATISQPYIVAVMTTMLRVSRTHRVLEIGTGSGYQAAILSQLAAHVYTVEIVPELAQSAEETLRQLGYTNVSVHTGDGSLGWPEQAPFDRILLTAAPEEIPEGLLAQLASGGRLIAPVGSTTNQELMVVDKDAEGNFQSRKAGSVLFIPMHRSAE
jgi:protein-L-isoaspartate(D-aspartate) O-methyltransferase